MRGPQLTSPCSPSLGAGLRQPPLLSLVAACGLASHQPRVICNPGLLLWVPCGIQEVLHAEEVTVHFAGSRPGIAVDKCVRCVG